MNVFYDPKADALDVVFRKGKVAHTRKIGREMYLDVDSKGEPLSLEILDARARFSTADLKNLSFNVTTYPPTTGHTTV